MLKISQSRSAQKVYEVYSGARPTNQTKQEHGEGNDTNNIKMEKDSWLKFKPSEKSYPLRDERHLSEALLFITITCKNLKDGSLSSLTD